jgi:serpin B
MHKTGMFGYAATDELQVLELPYRGQNLSMFVLLPKAVGGLAGLEKKLSVETLKGWTSDVKTQMVDVALPKFKTTSSFQLGKTLESMGMKLAFTSKADFSGMTGKPDQFISAVIHKAFVDVTEEGTEAAAATGVMMAGSAMPQKHPVFRADHPFLFLIRDNRTGTVLFVGRLMNPKE